MITNGQRERVAIIAFFCLAQCAVAKKGDLCHCMEDKRSIMQTSEITQEPTRASFPHLSDQEAELLLEYWSQADRLIEVYSDLEMFGVQERTIRRYDGQLHKERGQLHYYASKGERFRLDSFWVGVKNPSKKRELIGVINPGQQYLFGVDPKTGKNFLIGHANNRIEAFWELCQQSLHDAPWTDHLGIPIAPRLVFRVPQVPRTANSKVAKVSLSCDRNGREIVTVVYENANGIVAKFDLYRNCFWAVKHILVEGVTPPYSGRPHGEAIHAVVRCDYDFTDEKIPLLKRYELTWHATESTEVSDLKLRRHDLFTVTKIELGSPDPSVFDVNAIVGRDIQTRTPARRGILWILVLNGLLLFLVGLYLMRRKKRATVAGPGTGGSP